jgi:hypothetical protein
MTKAAPPDASFLAAGLFHGRDFERRSEPMHFQGATGY